MHTEIEQFNLGQYLNWVSAILFKRNYCQAQPQPTPANMSWESNIITTPGNQSTPYTFTHPVRIVVSPCSLHVNYLVLNNSWLVHHLMTCWWLAHVHNLFIICSSLVYFLFVTCSWTCLFFFCMSSWRSSRSVFWPSTGNNVSGHYKCHYIPFLFSVATFSHRRSAQIKKLI